jgi:pimeloyl-ACP methyl ester carboxylesterase
MSPSPIVLVPGFWLGSWAWDEVVAELATAGCDAMAITLPGLESVDADRSGIGMEDHVAAIITAVRDVGEPVVLALHSGAGASGYGAIDRVPELIAHAVYVDTGPAIGALGADFEGPEWPLPALDDLAEEENLDGVTDEQLGRFAERAVPQPGDVIRQATTLTNDARLDVPTTVICTGFTSDQYREAIEAGYAFVAGLGELRDVRWIDLPTGHWPMWSEPERLASILARIARDPSAAASS